MKNINEQKLTPTPALELKVYDGDKLIAQKMIESQSLILGRILSADFVIADPRISRFHALIERIDGGALKITDLGSSQGTFVNGIKIVEKILAATDEIKLASLKLTARMTTVIPETLRALHEDQDKTSDLIPTEKPRSAPAKKELTQVSSLREIARTRGVLDRGEPGFDLEVTLYWENTILAVDHHKAANKSLTLGSDPRAHYLAPDPAFENPFPFVELTDSGTARLILHPVFKGSVRVGGVMRNLEDLKRESRSSLQISSGDLAKIQVGQVHFFMMFVPRAPRVVMAPLLERDPLFTAALFLMVLFVTALLFVGYATQDPIEGKVVEFPEKLRRILIQEYQKEIENVAKNEPVPEVKVEQVKPQETPKTGAVAQKAETVPDAQMVAKTARTGGNEGEGAKEKGAEGKRGKPQAKTESGVTNRPRVAESKKTFDGEKKTKLVNKKPSAPAVVAPPDLLKSLKNSGLGARLAQVAGTGNNQATGDGGGAQGQDPLDEALSGVGGGGLRSGRGSGGSGLAGTSSGGGGSAVGVGGLGTQGFGGGAKGTGVGSLPGKGEMIVGTETSEIIIQGSLTREQIERVVNARMNEVRFCYQREMGRDPRLSGKVTLQWTIVTGGAATSVRAIANSTGSTSLAQCLRDRVERWQFPSPAGGSSATVDWSWSFKPAGT